MRTPTCVAAAALWDTIDPVVWVRSFADHLGECAECRSLYDGPELRSRATAYIRALGTAEPLPEPTLICEQVEFLASSEDRVNVDSFQGSYAEHILGCRRCLRLVPGAITPEVLVR